MNKVQQKRWDDNQGLLYYWANRYRNCGMEWDEIKSVCNVALARAVNGWDENSEEFKWATYAGTFFRSELRKAYFESIKMVGGYAIANNSILTRILRELENPTEDDFKELAKDHKTGLDTVKALYYNVVNQKGLSMDAPLEQDKEDSGTLGDYIVDTHNPNPEEILMDSSERNLMWDTLNMLVAAGEISERHKYVFERFTDPDEPSMRDIAGELNISGARVQQMIAHATEKIKKHINTKKCENCDDIVDRRKFSEGMDICMKCINNYFMECKSCRQMQHIRDFHNNMDYCSNCTKSCIKCNKTKHKNLFHEGRNVCKECIAIYMRVRRGGRVENWWECIECGKNKHRSQYHCNHRSTTCIECIARINEQEYNDRKTDQDIKQRRYSKSIKEKTCNTCGDTKPKSEFPNNRNRCKDCENARTRAWRSRKTAEKKAIDLPNPFH